MKQSTGADPLVALHALADSISATIADVMRDVDELRAAVTDMATSAHLQRLSRGDLRGLHPRIEAMLRGSDGLVVGAGFVADPDFLADAQHWVDWRMADAAGFHQLDVTFDVGAVANYDYRDTAWFAGPKNGVSRSVVGPYVDFGGTNAYVVTVTMPVLCDDRFIGVVGADLSVDRMEAVVRRLTRSVGFAAMVVTSEGRIVASSVPRKHPGTMIRGLDDALGAPKRLRKRMQVLACGDLPWRLVAFGCSDPRTCAMACGCAALR